MFSDVATFGQQSRFGLDKFLLVSNFPYINSLGNLPTEQVKIGPNLFYSVTISITTGLAGARENITI